MAAPLKLRTVIDRLLFKQSKFLLLPMPDSTFKVAVWWWRGGYVLDFDQDGNLLVRIPERRQ